MSRLSNAWRAFLERRFVRGTPPASLNALQEAFCEWNAERLGISIEESRTRFRRSWAALRGGHGGHHFKRYAELHEQVCSPFWASSRAEVADAYAAHDPIQFLRLLSYPEADPGAWPELSELESRDDVCIVDFGCGLAHLSRALAGRIRARGRSVALFLADLPLQQFRFPRWYCARAGLTAEFAECTPERPIPPLPRCDLCIATEVLEHVHEPEPYLAALAESVKPGGWLLTHLGVHGNEFLHVSPDLRPLADSLVEQGWTAVRPPRLYRKA